MSVQHIETEPDYMKINRKIQQREDIHKCEYLIHLTQYNCIPPVHNEQSELSSTSGINLLESQFHTNKYPQHVNTTHENEEEGKSNQCGYEKQGKDNASQLNGCNTDYGPHLNPDILENIIKTTVGRYPQMRQTLRAVSRFFQCVVDTLPLLQVYIPELAGCHIRHIRHIYTPS